MLIKDTRRGYTGMNIDGATTLETDILSAINLTSADLTLTSDQVKVGTFEVTTGSATYNIVIPAAYVVPGKLYIVSNADGVNAVNIKVAGGTAVTIALSKSAIVRVNSAGTNVVRVTPDA